MSVDLVVERRYREGGLEVVEQVTWRHVPDPEPGWRWQRRRFRKPRLVEAESYASPDPRARALPEWCAPPEYPPNRWLWFIASRPAVDLSTVPEPRIGSDGTVFHAAESPWWDYYALPLRTGVVLL